MKKESSFLIKKSAQLIFLIAILIVYPASPTRSQASNSYLTDPLPEKIYLQLDSKVYTRDQNIWFKSIVTDAASHIPTKKSSVLYVELIAPNEKIIEKKLIKLENGVGDGYFQLKEGYTEGSYLIRAYTKWNKNFGSDFFFKTYIQVFSTSRKEKSDPIKQIRLIEKEQNERLLQAYLDPFAIDSLHSKKIKLVITLDEIKDTLYINKGNDDRYVFNYNIPDKYNFVNLHIQTENLATHSRNIVLDTALLDLQFFPESGEFVHSLRSKVAFKAIDATGKGRYIEGEIVNQRGELIAQFKSNLLGMGYFILPIVDSTLTYFARLKSQSGKKIPLLYPLPSVAPLGNVLSVQKRGKNIHILAVSNYLNDDSVFFGVASRGSKYFNIKGRLKQNSLNFSLPVNSLPEGIIAFTMMNERNKIIAERLFFNERPENRLNIRISTDKQTYVQREFTSLNIDITNHENEPTSANLSLLVLNKEQMGQMESTRQHILSYFLINSDLKGKIENPRFYFNKDINRHNDLDALMLTQGWRKYKYLNPIDTIIHHPETSLSVSGSIKSGLFQHKKKEVTLTLVTMGDTKSLQLQTLEKLGKFNFNIPDEYGEELGIIIQSADKNGKNKPYTINLDKSESPAISFDYIQSEIIVDSTIDEFIQKNMMRKKVKDAFRLSDEGITLDEVLIEGYSMTPERKRVMDNFGKPKVVIRGKDIQEKEEKWSSGLFSVLKFHYPDKIKIVHQGNNMYARVIGAPTIEPGDGVTLIVIDGILVPEANYSLIPIIPPSEVKSVEIIQSAKNFKQHYMEVVPGSDILEAPAFGSVIAIYTHAGKGLLGIRPSEGLLQTSIPAFAQKKEFYRPKYTDQSSINWAKPDLRALVQWEPQIKIDSSGKNISNFYNADNLGEMKIIVEAISKSGKIGYQELIFNVEKRDF